MKDRYYLVHQGDRIIVRHEGLIGAVHSLRKGERVTEHFESTGAPTGRAWEWSARKSKQGGLMEHVRPKSRCEKCGQRLSQEFTTQDHIRLKVCLLPEDWEQLVKYARREGRYWKHWLKRMWGPGASEGWMRRAFERIGPGWLRYVRIPSRREEA